MDTSIYPPTQLYLPLAFCLTFLSIMTSVMLSDKMPGWLKGQPIAATFLVAMVLSFVHVGGLVTICLGVSLRDCQLGNAANLTIHLSVLIVIACIAIPLAKKMSAGPLEAITENLKDV